MNIKLSDLKIGDKAQILSFDVENAACRQKMFAYGLIPGAEISIARIAPLGDPLQIQLDGGIMLSIRKSEGRDVKVKRIS